jgi:Zn-dependent peptidase ImmA (M78 family)
VDLSAQFRLPAEAPDAEREELEAAIAALQTLASDYLRLEQLLESPLRSMPVPRYSYRSRRVEQDAESVAEAERRRLGLGDGAAFKLRELLERDAGLRIFVLPMPGSIAGLYGLSPDAGPCVAINSKHPAVRQRWSLAHEFGHFLTRQERPEITRISGYVRVPEQERFADQFASAFLLPASGLERRVRDLESQERSITVADLLFIADEYEVSLQALSIRLEGLRVLPPGTWDALRHSGANIQAASRLLGIRASAADTKRLPRRFIFLALEAYDRELLTERELADILDQDRLTVRAIIDQLSAQGRDVTEGEDWELPLSRSMQLET